jgi:hypothetical protein
MRIVVEHENPLVEVSITRTFLQQRVGDFDGTCPSCK